MQITPQQLLLDTNFATKDALFCAIAKKALDQNLITNQAQLVAAFHEREKQGTTGFEDRFAIPHARSNVVKKPALFVVRNKRCFTDWKALDGQGVQYALVLLIPIANSDLHIDLLATLATKLMDPQFRASIKKDNKTQLHKSFAKIIATISTQPSSPPQNTKSTTSKKRDLIVGISACPAGIAHTFMVKEKMTQIAQKRGWAIKWETQGANGQQNALTSHDLAHAKMIIIASDINLDLTRFYGKKIYLTTTNDVIKNGAKVVDRAQTEATIYRGKINQGGMINKISQAFLSSFRSSFGKPWFYFSLSAALFAFIALIGYAMYGSQWQTTPMTTNQNLFKMQTIASLSLYLAMPFMAATIVKKNTKSSEGFYLTLLGCLLMNLPLLSTTFNALNGFTNDQTASGLAIFYDWNGIFANQTMQHGSNILGALVMIGVVSIIYALITKMMNWAQQGSRTKMKRLFLMASSPWFNAIIPSMIILLGVVFLLGAPLSYLSQQLTYGLIIFPHQYWWLRLIIGFGFGALIAIDLGGTINKITLVTLIGLAQYDLRFGALIAIGIPLASLGLGVTYRFMGHRFRPADKGEAAKAMTRGRHGMTEGPLALTVKYGPKVAFVNIVATGIATGMSLMLGIYIFKGGLTGILFLGGQAYLGAANDLWWLNELLPLGQGIITVLCSIVYGIIGYYLVLASGCVTYYLLAQICFRIGKNHHRVWLKPSS